MASITKQPNGRRTVQFIGPDGARRSIRLGKVDQRTAESIKNRVEGLLAAKLSGCAIDADTARWVGGLDPAMAVKLAKVGLIASPEAQAAVTLGQFLVEYIAGRARLKPNTLRNYENTRKHLIDGFGFSRPVQSISAGDADQWRENLLKRLSPATVSREVKRARQFFRAAVRKKLIAENPFADVAAPAQVNSTRGFFVTGEVIARVIEACPDNQWRLLVALSRFGGLRCPSEHLRLTWADVDWQRNRITVHSPKTEHFIGGASRVIPMFPELRHHLEAVFDEAEPGTQYVITRYRDKSANLRTQLLRIIQRAGETPWPKLFHNLRASRQTELTASFPLHVVCAWIGNSAAIADKHYLQVNDDHYAKAVGDPQGKEALQNPVQSAQELERNEWKTKPAAHEKTLVFPGSATSFDLVYNCSAPPRGVEPLFSD